VKRRRSSNRLGIIGITAVVAILGGVLTFSMMESNKKLTTLTNQEAKLQEELEQEQTRVDELEEQRVYIQTKKYIEEAAKRFGLVYPDEVIFKAKE